MERPTRSAASTVKILSLFCDISPHELIKEKKSNRHCLRPPGVSLRIDEFDRPTGERVELPKYLCMLKEIKIDTWSLKRAGLFQVLFEQQRSRLPQQQRGVGGKV